MLTLQRERDDAQRALGEVQQQNAQNRQPIGQAPPVVHQNQQNVRVQNSDIFNIVSALGFPQLEYKLPKFSDENGCHPLEFLESLEKFFRVKNINDDRKMASIEIALEGNARVWLNLQNGFDDYNTFKTAFQARFFSIPIQVKVKNKWATREYNEKINGNFQSYFYQQAKEASYILPKMSEYEKNYIIMKQFPWWVQEALASANFEDANAIAHTLANLDAIRYEKNAKRESRQFMYNENNRNQQQFNNPQSVSVKGMYAKNQSQNNFNHSKYNRRNNYYNNGGNWRFRNSQNNNSNSGNLTGHSTTDFSLPDTRYPPPEMPVNYHNNNSNGNISNTPTNTEPMNLN